MSRHELENIQKLCAARGMHPAYFEHEPVYTSEDAVRATGEELRQGIKALLFANGAGEWVIVDIPGDTKADVKKIADARGWAKRAVRMATPEEVLEVTGCEIGSVPPFGHKTNIPILVDAAVFDNKENAFNIGLLTDTAKVPSAEMKALFDYLGATIGDFIKK